MEMPVSEFSNHHFLIIGGTTKAGTTSLYSYLADHPDVCASSLKETRFFLDDNYPVPISTPFSEDGVGYSEFFTHCEPGFDGVFMEATPDYLYSKTALQMSQILPGAKMIFILRNPIDRLVSWYKYAIQRGMLNESTSFKEYVNLQFNQKHGPDTPVHMRALKQGRYTVYIKAFIEKFGDRILLLSFDDLKNDPLTMLRIVCRFSDINPDYYDNYEFSVHNKSYGVKFKKIDRWYTSIRRRTAFKLHNNVKAVSFLRKLNRYLKPLIYSNYKLADDITVDFELQKKLRNYYRDDVLYYNHIKLVMASMAEIRA